MATSYKLKTLDGTAAAPAYTFEDDANSGMYSVSGDVLGLSVGGAEAVSCSTVSFGIKLQSTQALSVTTSQVELPGGTVGAPGIAFSGDEDTGLYRVAANNLAVGIQGEKSLSVLSKQVAVQTGVAAAPGLVGSDNNTGFLLGTSNVQVAIDGVNKFLFTSGEFTCTEDLSISADGRLILDESTPANIAAVSNAGVLFVSGSDNSLYYVNESGVTFIVSMTAV